MDVTFLARIAEPFSINLRLKLFEETFTVR